MSALGSQLCDRSLRRPASIERDHLDPPIGSSLPGGLGRRGARPCFQVRDWLRGACDPEGEKPDGPATIRGDCASDSGGDTSYGPPRWCGSRSRRHLG